MKRIVSETKPNVAKRPASVSVVETIIGRIKLDIRTGGYAPGQRLIEADVQRMTGASRGPVREAMRRLGAEGLLEIHHNKGARIRQLTRKEVENLYDVREVIEGLAAHRAAERADDPKFRKEIDRLETKFAQSFDGSAQSYMDYNARFHELIVKSADNAQLVRMVTELQIPIVMLRLYPIINRDFIARAHREHGEVIKYLLKGKGALAERTMRSHIRSTKSTVLKKATLLNEG